MSPDAKIEPIVGRYMRLTLNGRPQRIYFEEAGRGLPLLCLHTAGADARQFRDLLNDTEVTDRFRVLAFDMPWHGKSSPPPGWQDEEYRLTLSDYTEMVLGVADALNLDRPIVMGCSIGGRVVLNLALSHPERWRAVIGLQSGARIKKYYDLDWLHRADVHGGEVCAGVVSGLIGPEAPERDRWETLWHYMQSGPGVFKGDLYFYREDDGDLTDRLAGIDTARCPVYMLTGDYDYSNLPEDSRLAADAIAGAKLTIMEGLGHFPMSEDPERFRRYLLPVLSEIAAAGWGSRSTGKDIGDGARN